MKAKKIFEQSLFKPKDEKIINQEFKDKKLTILCTLKGAICLTADLIRH